jgi:NADH-quinone oxidoreductase subunit M
MEDIILNDLSYPVLTVTTFLPLAGALVILFMRNTTVIRWLALLTTVATFFVSLPIYRHFDKTTYKMQFVEIHGWIPMWDIMYKVGVDGISVLFIILTTVLSILCVSVSWRAIENKVKEFFLSLLVMEAAMIGLFASLNLFLFYFFWEIMLIPMFLLIGIWGGPNRIYAAIKFVLFTLAGSVLMLIGIIVLYYSGGETLDILALSKVHYPAGLQLWLFLGFFAAFAVKVPMFPVHTWLPDAHTEAPTAGSVILAGVLLKMGGYGFLRFSIPMFPDATRVLLVPMLALSLTAIIYGAYVTLTQKDLKRLIAYSSVSHMGFVTLGIFTLNKTGLEGGILQMINHGVVTGALFLCVGIIYERTHTREISDYGGLAKSVPVYSTFFAIFTLAAIGFPGMNAFIGEFLIISGAFQMKTVLGALSIWGVILGVAYMVWLYYRVALNEINPNTEHHLFDINAREVCTLIPLVGIVFLIGLQPEVLLSYMHTSVDHLLGQFNGREEVVSFALDDSMNQLAHYVKEIF